MKKPYVSPRAFSEDGYIINQNLLKNNINTGFNVAKRVSNVVNPNMIKSNKIYV